MKVRTIICFLSIMFLGKQGLAAGTGEIEIFDKLTNTKVSMTQKQYNQSLFLAQNLECGSRVEWDNMRNIAFHRGSAHTPGHGWVVDTTNNYLIIAAYNTFNQKYYTNTVVRKSDLSLMNLRETEKQPHFDEMYPVSGTVYKDDLDPREWAKYVHLEGDFFVSFGGKNVGKSQ